jgi:hypothetical protein
LLGLSALARLIDPIPRPGRVAPGGSPGPIASRTGPARFDPAEATEQIRAYLTGNPGNQARHNASAVEAFTAQTEKMLRTLQRAASRGTLQAAAHADPETVRHMIASVRSILDAIEQEAF